MYLNSREYVDEIENTETELEEIEQVEEKYYIDKKDKIKRNNRVLYRIIAVRDFHNIKAGDKGGYIGMGVKLSHNGTAWVYPGCYVSGKVEINDNCHVMNGCTIEAIQQAEIYLNDNVTISDSYVYAKYTDNITFVGHISIKNKCYITGTVHIESTPDLLFMSNVDFRLRPEFTTCSTKDHNLNVIICNGGNIINSVFLQQAGLSTDHKIFLNEVVMYSDAIIDALEPVAFSNIMLGDNAHIEYMTDIFDIVDRREKIDFSSHEHKITFYKTNDNEIWLCEHDSILYTKNHIQCESLSDFMDREKNSKEYKGERLKFLYELDMLLLAVIKNYDIKKGE